MGKISESIISFAKETRNKSNIPDDLKKKIDLIISEKNERMALAQVVEILSLANSFPYYLPEIFTLIIQEINEFFSLNEDQIEIVLSSINYWQDWKIGLKIIESITYQTVLNQEKWLILSEFTFKLGQLFYSLFKGSNYALTLLFFEKTLNFLSKAEFEKKGNVILSASLWFISQIEFEKGYFIKASDYQLSSMYYEKSIDSSEYEEYFQTEREKIRNSFIFSSFQAATEYFIAGKVAAQSFQYELAKNFWVNSYRFINRIIRIILKTEHDLPILTQIRTFLLQLHSIVEKEGFQGKHSCDLNVISNRTSEIEELVEFVKIHTSLLENIDKKIFWLSILDKGGISLFEYDFEEQIVSSKNTLYSSFMHVISKWGQVELDSGPVKELNFLGNSFVIEIQDPIEVITVVSKPDPEIHIALRNLANSFNKEYGEILQSRNWDGNIKKFEKKCLDLVYNLQDSLEGEK